MPSNLRLPMGLIRSRIGHRTYEGVGPRPGIPYWTPCQLITLDAVPLKVVITLHWNGRGG